MKKKIFIVAAVIISSQLCISLPVWAQPDAIPPGDSTENVLDEVILTANKYPKKQSETGKVITVINRKQLEKSSGKTLAEILYTVAGITIPGVNNNPGTNLTASIRGASAGNALILADGIPVSDPSANNNYFDLNFIPVEQIERIEILKGGQSTLYGSDAVAGVINIITKKADAEKVNISGSISGGSYNTFKQYAGINGRKKMLSYSAGYTHLSSKGFSAAYDRNNTGTFDKDGIDQHVANARIGFAISKKIRITIFGNYSFYKTDLDAGAYTDEKDYTVKNDNIQGGAGLTYNHSKGSMRLNYHFNYVERDYYDDSVHKSSPFLNWAKSRYIGRTHFAEIYNNWKWSSWELLSGIDFRYNNTDQFYRAQFPPFGPGPNPDIYETSIRDKNMHQLSPYASAIYTNKSFTTELGGRWNHHSEYGSNFTFTFNPSLMVNKKVKLFLNLYSAFKAPTLYQLYDGSAGNPGLEPEKGVIGEAGSEIFATKSFRFRVVGFYRHTKDAIVYTFDPSTFATKYMNVSKQKNYGVELEANYAISKWAIAANYTYTDGKITSAYDGTGAPIGKDTSYFNLFRIPKNAFNLSVGWQATKAFFISTQLRAMGERAEYIYGLAPEKLKGYATIDLYTEYKFSRIIKAFVDLKNLSNNLYFDFPGYNSRRFNFMAGVNVNL